MKLVKFGCGCIGTEDYTLINPCGDGLYTIRDGTDYILDRNKPGEPINKSIVDGMLNDINMLIADGYKYRRLKELLS